MALPVAWYVLLAIVSICGVGAWYIRNFTQNVHLLRVVAFTGCSAMAALLIWTWRLE